MVSGEMKLTSNNAPAEVCADLDVNRDQAGPSHDVTEALLIPVIMNNAGLNVDHMDMTDLHTIVNATGERQQAAVLNGDYDNKYFIHNYNNYLITYYTAGKKLILNVD
jgi:hypothetical protein